MRKFLASTLAAVTFAGALAATAGSAEARDYRRHHRDHDDDDAAAAAVIAGVAGLALGAALAGDGNGRGYYDRGYYAPRYGYDYRYDRPYAYGPPYGRAYGYRHRTCTVRERLWDPYIGHYVTVKRRYRC